MGDAETEREEMWCSQLEESYGFTCRRSSSSSNSCSSCSGGGGGCGM